ncbi:MAG: nascent polypeptide-associated complex protein [Candidatus Micrarchaeales archaeon]|nr:nascent polypeptide-associated complex protein [Candidatus Micrarchaeales archaeon]
MMPGMDPRQMKSMLAKMGIQTSEINALRVVIECADKDIVIENPQVTAISAQGSVSYQVAGETTEKEKKVEIEITEDDIKMVMDGTGASKEDATKALQDSNGDIAQAILALKK